VLIESTRTTTPTGDVDLRDAIIRDLAPISVGAASEPEAERYNPQPLGRR
jgi:hypothetical protein